MQKGKLIGNFTPIRPESAGKTPDIQKSGHEVTLLNKNRKNEKWFFKKYPPEQIKLAEYEAAISVLYRVLLNNRAPKIRVIYEDEAKTVILGSISKEIPGFMPLNVALKSYSLEHLIEQGLAKAIKTSKIRQDDDVHDRNLGFAPGIGVCRIDYDMSLYPLTSKIKGKRTIQGIIYPLPDKAFPVTPSNIKDIINSSDISAYHWPRKKEFSSLKDDPKFIYDEYRTLLKYILLDTDIVPSLIRPFLSSEEDVQNISQHEKLCHEEFSGVLFNMPEFREAVFKNPEYIVEILAEFEEYNKNIRGKDEHIINLEKIKENYRKIFRSSIEYQFSYQLINFEIFSLSLNEESQDYTKDFIRETTDILVAHYADQHYSPSKDGDFAISLRLKIETFKANLRDKYPEDMVNKINEHCNNIDLLLGYIQPHSIKHPDVINIVYDLAQKKLKTDTKELVRRLQAARARQEKPISKKPRQEFSLQNIADELYEWANNLDNKEYITKAIEAAYSEYIVEKWGASWRNDPQKSKEAQELKAFSENSDIDVTTLFSKILNTLKGGSWGPQSFNTLLIINLITQFSNYKNKDLKALPLSDFFSNRDYLLFYQQAPSREVTITEEKKSLHDIALRFYTMLAAGRPTASAALSR